MTVLAGVPTIWINLLRQIEQTGATLPKVHTVVCGGSAIPPALMEGMEKQGLRMLHAWGMTETSPLGTVSIPRSWQPEEESLAIRLKQGPPIPGVEIRIADLATGEELPWDGVAFGEVQVRGPWIANRLPSQRRPRQTDRGWLVQTGDVATIDPDGFVGIVDRTKDVIKSGGEWISTIELEGAIMAHPKVLEATVDRPRAPEMGERPVAFVVTRARVRGHGDAEEIRAFLDG